MQVILEYPKLKDGNRKELRRLHDTMLQDLRALKTIGDPLDTRLITSMIQLKLEPTMSFAWREASRDVIEDVPSYEDILKFLDQRAIAADNNSMIVRQTQVPTFMKNLQTPVKTVAVHVATNSANSCNCLLCSSEQHPLYLCPKFKAMSAEARVSTLASRHACFNCVSSQHTRQAIVNPLTGAKNANILITPCCIKSLIQLEV